MKLFYNNLALHDLGFLQILGTVVVREPAEAPQRERTTVRVALQLREQTYADNATLIEQLRAALKTQQAALVWEDDNGKIYVERQVVAGDDEQSSPEGWGTYRQTITFAFSYFSYDLTTPCLAASFAPAGGAALGLGQVDKWEEDYTATPFDPMRDPRKLVEGTVTAAGRFVVDPLLDVNARTAALLAAKEAMMAGLESMPNGGLIYGSFNRTVRVRNFKAMVNQPLNHVEWTLSVWFTRYPNEAFYRTCEFRFSNRVAQSEGIVYLVLTGKIGAATAQQARQKLADIKKAYIPAGYIQSADETDEHQVESVSGGGGDGAAFVELDFHAEYRDVTTLQTTWLSDGANKPLVDLGEVEKWSERFIGERFSEWRSTRKRAGGIVTASGKKWQPDGIAILDKQANLRAWKTQMLNELEQNAQGTLSYAPTGQQLTYGNQNGAAFFQRVRVLDFTAELDRFQNCIVWSLTASWTRFPNESDYSICEFNVGTRENKETGIVTLTLAGKIGSTSADYARQKLTRLRDDLVPDGYEMTADNSEEHRVSMESDAHNTEVGPDGDGDGETFIELTFNDEWSKAAGGVTRYELRTATADDAKTGWSHVSYSGTVTAAGKTTDAAYAVAAAKAADLGAGKSDFLISSSITRTDHQFLTSGDVFITVEFHYEYQQRGANTYYEVTSDLTQETFGMDTEQVSGVVEAPTLAAALATYAAEIRNLPAYNGAVILNERKPSRSQLVILSPARVAQDARFGFSFTVHRPKTTVAGQYSLEPVVNFARNEKTTVVRGNVLAPDAASANAWVDALIGSLSLGVRVSSARPEQYHSGPSVNGAANKVFKSLEFTETYTAILAGASAILECEVSVTTEYSGTRWIEKPLPDGVSIMQNCGIVPGGRTVTVNIKATTEDAVQTYIRKMRTAFITGPYEKPPRVDLGRSFLPLTEGVPTGGTANVLVYTGNASFTEVLPDNGFS